MPGCRGGALITKNITRSEAGLWRGRTSGGPRHKVKAKESFVGGPSLADPCDERSFSPGFVVVGQKRNCQQP